MKKMYRDTREKSVSYCDNFYVSTWLDCDEQLTGQIQSICCCMAFYRYDEHLFL